MTTGPATTSRRLTVATRGRLVAALALTAVVGLAAGTLLHNLTSPAPAEPPEAALHVTVADARLDLATTVPLAVLDVSLVTARADVQVVSAAVAGVGVAGPAVVADPGPSLARGTDPGGHLARLRVLVPLHCSDADLADVSVPALTLQLGHGATGGTTGVTADPTDWVLPGGLCQAVYQLLPQGWQHPAVVDSFTVDPARPETATVVVSGLPAGDPVVTIAPFRFPVQTYAEPRLDGTATITLSIQGCPTGPSSFPAGFALIAGSNYRYLPVGLAMSRWQLDFQRTHCP